MSSPRPGFRWSRSIADYAKVQRLVGALLRGRRLQFVGARRAKRYLNAGCGPNVRDGFLNLDYHWAPGVDLCWDLTKELPIPSRSIDGVYSEHCLEHLPYEGAIFALREFKRVLRPGGTARIVVPDAGLFIDLYARHAAGEAVRFPYVPNPPPAGFTPLVAINRVFRSYGHQFAYDAETMAVALVEAGLRDPRKLSYMVGRDPALLIDTEDRAVESLYMEAVA